ncbi:asparagine synthase (glutamine-hydrolyzing), partial [Verrucomicrobia bacterium]|nr:asparagine synthase (glutamine-hydrolyzing) [Verrucomicrobiota bacterium]
MCGFVGYFLSKNCNYKIQRDQLFDMINLLHHRGPDNTDLIAEKNWGLAHKRLSIIDLTENAHQPMKKYGLTLSFNGEIYNYRELREELVDLGYKFETESDTEVLIASFHKWREECFIKLNGIFAFAIYDDEHNQMYLCRDRLGIKPLYVYNKNGLTVFGSEIKSFFPCGYIDKSLSPQATVEYFWMNSPAGEQTVYQFVKKLKPGSYSIVSQGNCIKSTQYFNVESIEPTDLKEEDIVENIKTKLELSVKRQLVGDVPLCSFLSGGIDSSAITLFAAKHSTKQINTYSVEFDYYKRGKSELPNARQISRLANTNHHELFISSENIAEIVSTLCYHHDEPFSDAANIPLYLLTKQIKNSYKVVLQGDGGDELFGGYYHYNHLFRGEKLRGTAKLINNFNKIYQFKNPKLARYQKAIRNLASQDRAELVSRLVFGASGYSNPIDVLNHQFLNGLKTCDPFTSLRDYENYGNNSSLLHYLNIYDVRSVLPN